MQPEETAYVDHSGCSHNAHDTVVNDGCKAHSTATKGTDCRSHLISRLHYFQRIGEIRFVITPLFTLADIVTDVLAIYQYFNSTVIPIGFAWTLLFVSFCSFRFQLLWFFFLFNDSEKHAIGDISIQTTLSSYIPFCGAFLAWGSHNSSISKWRLIVIDIMCSFCFFAGPIAVTYVALSTWLQWMWYFMSCGRCGKEPKRRFVKNFEFDRNFYAMTVIGIEEFIADWESILESLPQTAIGTYVTFKYLGWPPSIAESMIIYVSLCFSSGKLCYTIMKLINTKGHRGGTTVMVWDEFFHHNSANSKAIRDRIVHGKRISFKTERK